MITREKNSKRKRANMNGYELMANGYKTSLKLGKIDQDEAKRKIRIFTFLAKCSDDEIYDLFDSSAFNSIIKKYLRLAMKNIEADKKISEEIIQELVWLFDTVSAKEIDGIEK